MVANTEIMFEHMLFIRLGHLSHSLLFCISVFGKILPERY